MSYRTLENESLLVKSLSKGDLLAFNTLYKEYSGRLYRFAFGYLKIENRDIKPDDSYAKKKVTIYPATNK